MVGNGIGARRGTAAWRHVVVLALALLAIAALAGVALWLQARLEHAHRHAEAAEAARVETLVELIAAQQRNAAYAPAAALAASEPRLPRAFKDNAALGRYETATLLDVARLPIDQKLDVEWLQAAAGSRPVLVSWGWSSGVNTLEVGTRTAITHCGLMPGAPRIRIASDGHWFSVLNLPTHETALLPAPACAQPDPQLTAWSAYIAQQEGRGVHVAATLPLPGPQLLLGWADGRVELLRKALAPLPITRFDAAAVGLISNNAGTNFALLSRNGRLELVDANGRSLASPLKLQRGTLATTHDEAWVAFLRDADLPASHALLLDQGAADARAPAVLGIVLKPESASFFLHDLADAEATVFDVAVALAPNDGCPTLEILGARRLGSYPMDASCGNAPAARAASEIPLPGDWLSSTAAARGMTAGAFCEGGSTMVLGTAHGELLWMRHVQAAAGSAARVDIEHAERSAWDDAVTALACREDGSVHAGYRTSGVKAFRPSMHLQQRLVGIRTARNFAEVFFEDQSWPVETLQGPAKLEFFADSGELRLLQKGRLVWRRKVAEPAPLRPSAGGDDVTAVLIDRPRNRIWVLTTLGRLSLLDLNTGALLVRFSTSFFAAAPNKEVALEQPTLDASGQLSFVHRFRDVAMRVVVEEGTR